MGDDCPGEPQSELLGPTRDYTSTEDPAGPISPSQTLATAPDQQPEVCTEPENTQGFSTAVMLESLKRALRQGGQELPRSQQFLLADPLELKRSQHR